MQAILAILAIQLYSYVGYIAVVVILVPKLWILGIQVKKSQVELTQKKNLKEEITESVTIEIKKMLKKYSHKDVVEFISKKENLPKKMIYNYCLKLKK